MVGGSKSYEFADFAGFEFGIVRVETEFVFVRDVCCGGGDADFFVGAAERGG